MKPTRPTYKAREFAELTGVTVRALHHYDRIGLLKPKRTLAGYRVYSMDDLQALQQIVVLKFIGIPLRRIAGLRTATAERLSKTFARSLERSNESASFSTRRLRCFDESIR
jgi:DNA-binding transcriptional MerR regulator